MFTKISPKAGNHNAQQTGSLLTLCKIHLSSESKAQYLKKTIAEIKSVTRKVI